VHQPRLSDALMVIKIWTNVCFSLNFGSPVWVSTFHTWLVTLGSPGVLLKKQFHTKKIRMGFSTIFGKHTKWIQRAYLRLEQNPLVCGLMSNYCGPTKLQHWSLTNGKSWFRSLIDATFVLQLPSMNWHFSKTNIRVAAGANKNRRKRYNMDSPQYK